MNDRDRHEIDELRAEIRLLRQRLDRDSTALDHLLQRLAALEARLAAPSPESAPPPASVVSPKAKQDFLEAPPIIAKPSPVAETLPTPPPSPASTAPLPPKESWEIKLGTYWLPRVGIVMVLTALVFLAYYVHSRLSVPVKVAGLYTLCAVGIGLGLRFEKKYDVLGRVLFAGGLAGTYFVTYALHYASPLRLIESAFACGVLLFVIVAGIVALAQWKNRPWLAGLAFLLGYYTSAISDVNTFTLVSNCLLAGGALYLMLVSGWTPLTGLGLLGTYVTYALWLVRHGDEAEIRFKLLFVLLYWGLFTLAVFSARGEVVTAVLRNVFATINNLLGFVFLTQAMMAHHKLDQHWKLSVVFGATLLGLAWVARRQFKDLPSTFATYLISGLGLLTLGVVEKYSGYQQIAALGVEALVLLLLGHLLRQSIFRWFGAIVALVCLGFMVGRYDETALDETRRAVATWFAVGMLYLCAIVQHWHTRAGQGSLRDNSTERILAGSLAFLANLALWLANWDFLPERWRASAAVLECAVIAAVAGTAGAGKLALSCQMLLLGGYGSLFCGMIDHWQQPAPLHLPILLVAVTLGIAWFTDRSLTTKVNVARWQKLLVPVYIMAATAAAWWSIVQRVDADWRLPALMLGGLVTACIGFVWRNLWWRRMAMAILAASFLGWLGNDFAREIGWKDRMVVVGHFVAIALAIAAERVLRATGKSDNSANERTELVPAVFVGITTCMLLRILWRTGDTGYLTALWTLAGFGLFGLGLLLKERAYRWAGLAVVGVSVGRAAIYDFWQIEEPLYRILSFIALGVILLVLGYVYARFREKIAKWL